MTVFDYPDTAHVRRHGPSGYQDCTSYRDWLRDEFSFRCVYCLMRELWGQRSASFHIDHFTPQAHDPARALDYDNLVYVCAACNALKGDGMVPDPCRVAYGRCVRVNADGTVAALSEEGEWLIDELRLDSPDRTRFRQLIMRTLASLARCGETQTLTDWIRYPNDLPDLRRKREPGNSRPKGRDQCCFARRERGELPETY
ncbi:MAG: HNH endonuclease [Patescibacteria group bacterium]|nr:HNH endonuclease [Patescibacteria group bacterium]